jgi:hypothetical protein
MTGTDVGSGEIAVSVDAHESRDFSLQISASGRYRLRLTYLEGETDIRCPIPDEHAATISSKPFSLYARRRSSSPSADYGWWRHYEQSTYFLFNPYGFGRLIK